MQLGRIHCQVMELPDLDDLAPCDEGRWPRDLLPWADPYVALLMLKLQRQHGETEELLDDEFTLYQFAAEHWLGDDWHPDDEQEAWPDIQPRTHFPPVYGGFPLLNDLGSGDTTPEE